MPELVKLGDYAEVITGNPFKSSRYTSALDGIKLLRGDNVAQGKIRWEDAKRWPWNEVSSCARYELRVGDVVLAMDRPWIEEGLKYAELRPSDVPSLLVQRVACLRAGSALEQRFLAYLIGGSRFADYIVGVQTGTAVPHISTKQIQDFEFEMPSLGEQRAISEILGALDDKIAVNGRIAQGARDLAQSYFRAAVELSDGGVAALSAVTASVSRGVSPRYTDDESQLRVLNQKCVRGGRVSLGPSRRTYAEKVPSAKLLQPNDVLVNSTGVGTLGRVARWTRAEACAVDSHVSVVRFDETEIDPLCAGFAMLDAEPEIEALGEGSTGQTELSRARLSALQITVLSGDEEKKLRPVLDALESRGDSALEESVSLARLRDKLLPKLMSGEIRVRDAEKVVQDVT
jgi:type I restriction enzyme S subunit